MMSWGEWSAAGLNRNKANALPRLPIRGGNWNNGAIAGVRALNLNNARSNVNSNIGARPALVSRQKLVRLRAARQYTHKRTH